MEQEESQTPSYCKRVVPSSGHKFAPAEAEERRYRNHCREEISPLRLPISAYHGKKRLKKYKAASREKQEQGFVLPTEQ